MSKDNIWLKGLSQTTGESDTLANNTRGPVIEIRAASGLISSGLVIKSNDCTIEGLIVNKFQDYSTAKAGIEINGGDRNKIIGCYVGTTATGEGDAANGYGVLIQNSANNNIVGGTTSSDRNLISSNGINLRIYNSDSAEVYGNYLGVDRTGLFDMGATYNGINMHNANYTKIGNATAGGSISYL